MLSLPLNPSDCKSCYFSILILGTGNILALEIRVAGNILLKHVNSKKFTETYNLHK